MPELTFSVVKATLQLQMSFCLSVRNQNPSASQNCSYWPLSLSTIEPIDHWACWPLNLLTIGPSNHQAYRPSSLSTIKPINHWPFAPIDLWSSFATFKPFSLLLEDKLFNFNVCENFQFFLEEIWKVWRGFLLSLIMYWWTLHEISNFLRGSCQSQGLEINLDG